MTEDRQPQPERLAIIGLPGVGKSTVGRLLAERLALPFWDSDAEIEREAGRTIPELFRRDGEERFRALERRIVMRLARAARGVIALGGGAPCDSANRAVLRDWRCIQLEAHDGDLLDRLSLDRARPERPERPLLGDRDLPRALQQLRRERCEAYRRTLGTTGILVDTSGVAAEEVVRRVLRELGGS